MTRELLGRGWAFPFRVDGASGAVAMSRAEDNIRENITLILGTRPGERQMLPEFGCRIHELMFQPGTQANAGLIAWHIQESLGRWEPRIDVVEVNAVPDGTGKVGVQVKYRVKTTKAEHTLDLDLAGG